MHRDSLLVLVGARAVRHVLRGAETRCMQRLRNGFRGSSSRGGVIRCCCWGRGRYGSCSCSMADVGAQEAADSAAPGHGGAARRSRPEQAALGHV